MSDSMRAALERIVAASKRPYPSAPATGLEVAQANGWMQGRLDLALIASEALRAVPE